MASCNRYGLSESDLAEVDSQLAALVAAQAGARGSVTEALPAGSDIMGEFVWVGGSDWVY